MAGSNGEVTQLLRAAREGEDEALDRVFPLVYEQLERLARSVRHRSGADAATTGVMVEEAFQRLLPDGDLEYRDRLHFFRLAAKAMREVLVDAAVRRAEEGAGMAGGGVSLVGDVPGVSAENIQALDGALRALEHFSPQQARIVELRMFGGLTAAEVGDALELSADEVNQELRMARAWITARLADSAED